MINSHTITETLLKACSLIISWTKYPFWNRNLNTFIFQQIRHVNTTEVDRLWTHYPNTSSLSPLHWIILSQDRIRSDITNLFLLLSYQSSLPLFRRISPNHIFFHLSKPISSGVFFNRVSILKQSYIWNCMLDISEESIISRLYFSFPQKTVKYVIIIFVLFFKARFSFQYFRHHMLFLRVWELMDRIRMRTDRNFADKK